MPLPFPTGSPHGLSRTAAAISTATGRPEVQKYLFWCPSLRHQCFLYSAHRPTKPSRRHYPHAWRAPLTQNLWVRTKPCTGRQTTDSLSSRATRRSAMPFRLVFSSVWLPKKTPVATRDPEFSPQILLTKATSTCLAH